MYRQSCPGPDPIGVHVDRAGYVNDYDEKRGRYTYFGERGVCRGCIGSHCIVVGV